MTKKTLWHSLEVNEAFSELDSNKEGLTESEAKKRVKEYGANELPKKKRASRLKILFDQFKSPLIYILIVAGSIELWLGGWLDATVIFAAVGVNTLLGYIQENKAEGALEKLSTYVSYKAKVLRDGEKKSISSDKLVPGDIVILEAGDRVPADGRLFETSRLEMNEASLTGESTPVKKNTDTLERGLIVGDRVNMAFMATVVTNGHGKMVVTQTGLDTQIGEVAGLISQTKEEKTPLQLRIQRMGRVISLSVLVVAIFIWIQGWYSGFDLFEIFKTSVAIAVASIPEGLPVGITVILTVGMQRILKKKALVRRLVAVETLGSTSIILSDKTGTLTVGKMNVDRVVVGTEETEKTEGTERKSDLEWAYTISAVCNDAEIKKNKDGEEEVLGDPTEVALIRGVREFGLNEGDLFDKYSRLDDLPFDSDNKYMATLNSYDEKHNIVFLKGAPEVVLGLCDRYHVSGDAKNLTDDRRDFILEKNNELSSNALRVLAVAYKLVPKNRDQINGGIDESDFIYVGLMGMRDPLRKDSKPTLALTKKAGIRTIIITGDHKLTTKAIAEELGYELNDKNIVEGHDLDNWSDDELEKRVNDIDIYARVSPHHKIRIAKAWQAHDEVVAMLGDGVNDAPALKAADIGVALGSGTDVAKETADIVLLNDNFKTIVMAVKQGRIIIGNIRKVVLYLLDDSFSEVILIVGALALGLPLPVTAVQILYINIITDGLPDLALAFEPGDDDVMDDRPRPKNEGILNRQMIVLIFVFGLIADLMLFGVYYLLYSSGMEFEQVRTIIFMILALDSLLYAFSCKNLNKSFFKTPLLNNKYLLAAVAGAFLLQMSSYWISPLREAMGLSLLEPVHWLLIAGGILIKFTAVEIGKWTFYRKK